MADDWDPAANATPFGPQAGDTPAPPPEAYDPGGAPRKPPSPLTHTYQNGAPVEIPAGSYEYPGGGSAAPDIKGMWTGDSSVKRPEVPFLSLEGLGLGVTDPKAWGLVGNMMTSRNPADLERGIQSRVPEAKFAGEGDERTVQVPGGPEMYLDRPGVTPQKGLFYVPQTAAAIASGGRSLPAQMALGGAQHGLSQARELPPRGSAVPRSIRSARLSRPPRPACWAPPGRG